MSYGDTVKAMATDYQGQSFDGDKQRRVGFSCAIPWVYKCSGRRDRHARSTRQDARATPRTTRLGWSVRSGLTTGSRKNDT
jgi:hypothetical protein